MGCEVARGTRGSNPVPSSSESDELPEGLGSCIQVFVSVWPRTSLLQFSLAFYQTTFRSRVSTPQGNRCSRMWISTVLRTMSPAEIFAVLEFGPAETLVTSGAMSPAYARLCRMRCLPWPAHSREKPASSHGRLKFRETRTLRWRGESAANPSLNRRSDEFLESIKKGSKRQSACRLFLVIKISCNQNNFTQF